MCIGCLSLTIYVFFVYSRKVNDSNDNVNIRTDEKNSSLRDDIKTLNISELSSSAELSRDDKVHSSGSNEMHFANSEEIRCNHCLFDERRYEKEFTSIYYNFNKKGYLCKIFEVFCGESSGKPGGSRGVWLHNPGKKLTWHDKLENHKDAINSLTNLKIKDAFEKIDRQTNWEKNRANELYVKKLIRIVHFLARNNLPVKELYF